MFFSRQKKDNTDYLLGGKLKMFQPKDKYCVSIDAIFLGSIIKESKPKTLLDVGFGTGAVSFTVLLNNPNLKITGLEIQDEMIDIAKKNIELNDFKNITLIKGDLKKNPIKQDFDYVITNPPYFTGTISPNKIKTLAHQELETSLSQWLEFCIKRTKNHGIFVVIHLPEKLPEILSILKSKQMGAIEIFPLTSFDNESANRIIVKAKKGSKSECILHHPIIIHQKNKKYTKTANKILKGSFLSVFSLNIFDTHFN